MTYLSECELDVKSVKNTAHSAVNEHLHANSLIGDAFAYCISKKSLFSLLCFLYA